MSGERWQVVRVERVQPGRVRLWFVVDGEASQPVTIDAERDTPETRQKVADVLIAERIRLHRPQGPVESRRGAVPPSLGG